MANIIKKIGEIVNIYKAIVGLKQIFESVQPELKEDIRKVAADIDEIICKVQDSPSELDDRIVPLLKPISEWLKKISA